MNGLIGSVRRSLRGRAKRLGIRTLRRLARRFDLDVVERTIYSPIPDVPADPDLWERPATLAGLELDPLAHLEYLEGRLSPYLAEFRPPLGSTGREGEFFLENGYYQAVDAEVLYAMIRCHKPRRLLELGSGYSTLVSAQACLRNARDGHPVELVAVDPDPRIPLGEATSGHLRLESCRAGDLPLERFLALDRGDILFVDTSHTVKLGSEVNFLILEILPRLRPGVLVHVHDIFLPHEYPRAWFERGTYLTEQYLLHAFLIDNPNYEVVFAAHAVARAHRDRLARLIPSLETRTAHPAAFWIARRESGVSA